MCDTCGCGEPGSSVTYQKPGENQHSHSHGDHLHTHHHEHEHGDHHHHHDHPHDHDHHHHEHGHEHGKTIQVETDVMQKNNLLAERNRGFFEARNIFALNLVSSPGSGKTTLLEKTIQALKQEMKFYVIEGDQQTLRDAERIDRVGAPVIQVNTGNGCHLDAHMVNHAVKQLNPEPDSILLIENVGNLVCPSLFDLGEAHKVVIISVTEGDDKPLKYPTMFQHSDVCIINKIDLLPHVEFDLELCKKYALQVNPHLTFFEISATKGEGMGKWLNWLKENVAAHGQG
ncbi:MAG: hydrogenase nickel incorporation protein HypB [Caldisericaceae bacterium]|nr:hydrogenase nickel incorporation protein HypB [Caldisericaceae bacterium]